MDIENLKQIFRRYYLQEFENFDFIKEDKILNNESVKEIIKDNKKIIEKNIKVFGENSIEIFYNLNQNEKLVIIYKIFLNKNSKLNMKIKGKISGELYSYIEITHNENSESNLLEIYISRGKVIAISNVEIPENAIESNGNLSQYLLQLNNNLNVLFPILNVRNNKSKGFHSSKIIKLDKEQLFYLNSRNIKDIDKLLETSLLEI